MRMRGSVGLRTPQAGQRLAYPSGQDTLYAIHRISYLMSHNSLLTQTAASALPVPLSVGAGILLAGSPAHRATRSAA